MNKKYFALIGHPIEHSMSPFIHKRLFELSKICAEYEILNIPPFDLKNAFLTLKNFDGFNVTLPHKKEIIYHLNRLSNHARLCGAVNTVKNIKNSDDICSIGYNTDSRGFIKSLKESNLPLKGRVVVLGCGGAARSMAFELTAAGCETVIAVRPQSLSKASLLAGDIYTNTISPNIQTCLISELKGHIDLLVNATPVGMYPNVKEMPIEPDILKNCAVVYDAIYNPSETLLLKTARSLGLKTINGINMLIWQSVYSHEIWNNTYFEIDDINQLKEDTIKKLKKQFKEA